MVVPAAAATPAWQRGPAAAQRQRQRAVAMLQEPAWPQRAARQPVPVPVPVRPGAAQRPAAAAAAQRPAGSECPGKDTDSQRAAAQRPAAAAAPQRMRQWRHPRQRWPRPVPLRGSRWACAPATPVRLGAMEAAQRPGPEAAMAATVVQRCQRPRRSLLVCLPRGSAQA
eukprot:11228349-Lingulodinium_polyedra.AAC.1